MSKRFGRNQKRKLRTELKQARENAAWKDKLLHDTLSANKELDRKFRKILALIEVITSDSVLLEAKDRGGLPAHTTTDGL